MRRYMVVYSIPDDNPFPGNGSAFFEEMYKADQFKFDIEIGCGGIAQVYEWNENHHMYEFVYE